MSSKLEFIYTSSYGFSAEHREHSQDGSRPSYSQLFELLPAGRRYTRIISKDKQKKVPIRWIKSIKFKFITSSSIDYDSGKNTQNTAVVKGEKLVFLT